MGDTEYRASASTVKQEIRKSLGAHERLIAFDDDCDANDFEDWWRETGETQYLAWKNSETGTRVAELEQLARDIIGRFVKTQDGYRARARPNPDLQMGNHPERPEMRIELNYPGGPVAMTTVTIDGQPATDIERLGVFCEHLIADFTAADGQLYLTRYSDTAINGRQTSHKITRCTLTVETCD